MKLDWIIILLILLISLFIIYYNSTLLMLFAMAKIITYLLLWIIAFEHPKSTYYFKF